MNSKTLLNFGIRDEVGAVEGIEGGALALGAHEARGDHEHLVEAVQGAAFDPGIGQLCEALL